ncbi:hypothetical protein [Actinomadura roseirufa]|uniref:hypothetical protein n=1 Tax=Actinomadura roseirufa TaxID=2094049 RepID=UPI0013F16618|nr:hypothetical protein [Actinomadura roseirufa]
MNGIIEAMLKAPRTVPAEEPLVLRGAIETRDHLTISRVHERMAAGGLRAPYFSVPRPEARPGAPRATRTRAVVGSVREWGFADPAALEGHLAAGDVVLLEQVSHWHRATRTFVAELERAFPVAVRSAAYWSGRAGTVQVRLHGSGRVLALQLEGESRLAGTVLEAGDALWLERGDSLAFTTSGESLHLIFELGEPTAREFLIALSRYVTGRGRALFHHYHHLDLPSRSEALRDEMTDALGALDDDVLLAYSLAYMRGRSG